MSRDSGLCLSLCCYGLLLTLASRYMSPHLSFPESPRLYHLCLYTTCLWEPRSPGVPCMHPAVSALSTHPHIWGTDTYTAANLGAHLCKIPSARVSALAACWRQAWASFPHLTRNDIRLAVEISHHHGSIYTTRMHARSVVSDSLRPHGL